MDFLASYPCRQKQEVPNGKKKEHQQVSHLIHQYGNCGSNILREKILLYLSPENVNLSRLPFKQISLSSGKNMEKKDTYGIRKFHYGPSKNMPKPSKYSKVKYNRRCFRCTNLADLANFAAFLKK